MVSKDAWDPGECLRPPFIVFWYGWTMGYDSIRKVAGWELRIESLHELSVPWRKQREYT